MNEKYKFDMEKFKRYKKSCDHLAKVFSVDTFADEMLDDLARAWDSKHGTTKFMKAASK